MAPRIARTTTRRKAVKKTSTRTVAKKNKPQSKPAPAKQAGAKAKKISKGSAPKSAAQPSEKTTPSQSVTRLILGSQVPEFSCAATSGRTLSSKEFKGRRLVLYFYPKDNTPGCTLEGQDFRRLYREFQKANCDILGVSRDSIKSHENFKGKCDFPFELLSDVDERICRLFDVIQMKSLYGRKFEGIERSTFVIDEKGVLRAEWRKVKVPGHAEEVLTFVQKDLK